MNRTWVGVGVGAACMAAIACGADGEVASEMLEDAGQMLVDAGQLLVDAGSDVDAKAGAQTPGGVRSETHEVACTDALVRTEMSGGATYRWITRLADLVTNTADITGVDVITCGLEGVPIAETCTTGATCSGVSQVPRGDCNVGWAYLDNGKVRAHCGLTAETNGLRTPGFPSYRTARITIRR